MTGIRFSKEAEKKFNDIVGRYPQRDAALLPVLWLAQEEFDVLTPEVRSYIAEKLDVSLARVESVVSFYTMYRTRPSGKHHIQVCRNISCVLRGCEELMKFMESNLGLRPGDTSADGLFTYSTVECIAACGGAPALQVNADYHENMTPKGLAELIGKLKDRGTNR